MSTRGEMWVHGNAFVPQFPGGAGPEGTNRRRLLQVFDPTVGSNVPWSDLTGLRTGPALRFQAERGNENFFHVVIPTPAIVPDPGRPTPSASRVDAVSLYWKSSSRSIQINNIFVSLWAEDAVSVPVVLPPDLV